jgi:hypothetical protein
LTNGSVVGQADHNMTLSHDAAGTVTIADGSVINFSNVDHIHW